MNQDWLVAFIIFGAFVAAGCSAGPKTQGAPSLFDDLGGVGSKPGVFNFVNSGQIFPSDRAAFVDYNNDGWVDLAAGMLWTNDGEGNLEDVLSLSIGGTTWGDFNNDGFEDFYDYQAGTLWRNDAGTGDFTQISLPEFPSRSVQGATWIDIDLDGFLDLYIGGYETPVYTPDSILRNNGDETFDLYWISPADAVVSPVQSRPGRGISVFDYDEDGDMDVYVSNYRLEPNGLWENDGSGNFIDVAGVRGATGGFGHTIGSAVGDVNNDGHFDIFVGNFSHPGQESAHFLSNSGPGSGWSFVREASLDGTDWQESYASAALGDADNDGDLDLLFTTVYSGDATRFYDNQGDWTFVNVTAEAGLGGFGATYQVAFGDVDNDGDLDVVSNSGVLYLNETNNEFNWLKVKILGDPDQGINISAIGAQVRVTLDNGSIITRQVEVATGQGNANEQTLHFGLGKQEDSVSVKVRWPGGPSHTIEDVALNQLIVINTDGELVEGDTAF